MVLSRRRFGAVWVGVVVSAAAGGVLGGACGCSAPAVRPGPAGYGDPMSAQSRFDRRTLPEVEAVDVAPITNRDETGSFVRVEGAEAERMAALFRGAPDADSARCHVPSFRLRFRDETGSVLDAAVCWTCNNISIVFDGGGTGWAVFDGESDPARELMEMCLRLHPHHQVRELETD